MDVRTPVGDFQCVWFEIFQGNLTHHIYIILNTVQGTQTTLSWYRDTKNGHQFDTTTANRLCQQTETDIPKNLLYEVSKHLLTEHISSFY